MAETHITDIAGRIRIAETAPTNPVIGDIYYDPTDNHLMRWTGNTWIGYAFTSSSTSTTTTTSTSTSTSTTSTSTSTSTTTSTSTSTTTTG